MIRNKLSREEKKSEDEAKEDDSQSTYEQLKSDISGLITRIKVFTIYILPPVLLAISTLPPLIYAIGLFPADLPTNYELALKNGVYWSYGVWGAAVPTLLVRDWMVKKNKTKLGAYDPKASFLAVWEVSSHILDNMEIVTPEGEPLDIDDLDNLHTKDGVGYALLDYDVDANKVIATPLAEMNTYDLRFHKKGIEEVLTNTYKIADAAIEVLSQREGIAREAAMKEILSKIERSEDINLDSSTEITALEDLLKADDIDTDELVPEFKKRMDEDKFKEFVNKNKGDA